jgi:glutamate racemase
MSTENNRNNCIGVFDSGVGGLSVLAHIRARLPHESLHYVADTAWLPYGCKPEAVVAERVMRVGGFLADAGCKAIVVACNTATAAAIQHLRDAHPIPVIGMEPGIKPAVEQSPDGMVGILATTATTASGRFRALQQRFAGSAELIVQPCPGLVEAIEEGDTASNRIEAMLEGFLAPLLARGVDTLVLGCTHYPFVLPEIRRIAGEDVRIIDTGEAIARRLQQQLHAHGLEAEPGLPTSYSFHATGSANEALMRRLWGSELTLEQLEL